MTTTIESGSAAESRAVQLLVRKGYKIVERNFRCQTGELDVVARDGDVLVFVEVRSRANGDHGHATEMVDVRKQRQVAKVAHSACNRAVGLGRGRNLGRNFRRHIRDEAVVEHCLMRRGTQVEGF